MKPHKKSNRRGVVLAGIAVVIANLALYYGIKNSGASEPLAPLPAPLYESSTTAPSVGPDLLKEWDTLANIQTCEFEVECRILEKLLPQVTIFKQYVAEGFQRAFGKKIDFVLFYHRTMNQLGNESLTSAFAESNQKVHSLLLRLHPDLVGTEGCYDVACNLESELRDAKRGNREFQIPLPPNLEQAVKEMARESWYLQLLEKYPGAPLVGVDNFYIHSLDQMLAAYSVMMQEGRFPDKVFMLYRLRSQWAVARMVHLMEANHATTGTVVMGWAHGADFKALIPRLGLTSRIYGAAPAIADPAPF